MGGRQRAFWFLIIFSSMLFGMLGPLPPR